MYILQENLFSFEELQKLDPKQKLVLFFRTLDLRPYAKKMRSASPQGAKGHCRESIIRALLAAPLENISTFTALHERLDKDLRFRFQCGFPLDHEPPSISTLSRSFELLTTKGLMHQLFQDLVQQCREEGLIQGTHVAIDATAIHSYEKKVPKSRCKDSENASWGAKYDTFGNKITWFGYKIHLAVDAASDLPIEVEVTPAHVYDGEMGPTLMKNVDQQAPKQVKFFILDAGYDQLKNYEMAQQLKSQAIIPLNLRNEKEPVAGFTSHGTPRCSMGYDMVYWGADRDYLKFRCPHVLGKVDCPHGSAWCSSSNYGMVVKINPKDDLRRFCVPHRNTRNWEEIYDMRTSAERCNSRLKVHLTADDAHVQGLEKVKTHVYMNAIILLASALAMKRNVKENQRVA